eukprot:TRINITY_DN67654_c8_g6_i1.p1 TRINITY_DN67654_c8_g6~~TRINITY_DN67654_c8_g6_i1.p1  ORF type:complete len:375 (+),score=53.85 TRINITY_DN67654_c8_g6_i1:60-1184(+)
MSRKAEMAHTQCPNEKPRRAKRCRRPKDKDPPNRPEHKELQKIAEDFFQTFLESERGGQDLEKDVIWTLYYALLPSTHWLDLSWLGRQLSTYLGSDADKKRRRDDKGVSRCLQGWKLHAETKLLHATATQQATSLRCLCEQHAIPIHNNATFTERKATVQHVLNLYKDLSNNTAFKATKMGLRDLLSCKLFGTPQLDWATIDSLMYDKTLLTFNNQPLVKYRTSYVPVKFSREKEHCSVDFCLFGGTVEVDLKRSTVQGHTLTLVMIKRNMSLVHNESERTTTAIVCGDNNNQQEFLMQVVLPTEYMGGSLAFYSWEDTTLEQPFFQIRFSVATPQPLHPDPHQYLTTTTTTTQQHVYNGSSTEGHPFVPAAQC